MPGSVREILMFEPTRAKSNPILILGAVFLLFFFGWISWYIWDNAQEIERIADLPKEQSPLTLLKSFSTGGEIVQELVANHSPFLSLFFLLSIWGTPWFVMLIASDQISSDLGRKHLRFLLTRTSRWDLYFARALGSWLEWTILVGLLATIISIVLTMKETEPQVADNVVFTARIILTLSVYGLPFIAMMAFFNTFIPNPFLVYLMGIGIWLLVGIISSVFKWINETAAYLQYLMPSAVKYPLMAEEPMSFIAGIAGAIGYTLVFFLLGAWIFQARDV